PCAGTPRAQPSFARPSWCVPSRPLWLSPDKGHLSIHLTFSPGPASTGRRWTTPSGEGPIRTGGKARRSSRSTVDGSSPVGADTVNGRSEQGDCRTLVCRILGKPVEPCRRRSACRAGHPVRILHACASPRPRGREEVRHGVSRGLPRPELLG